MIQSLEGGSDGLSFVDEAYLDNTPRGGLRDRFVTESVYRHVKTHLDTLGWFGPNRQHTPITVVFNYPEDSEVVQLNTLAFSSGASLPADIEMGSTLVEMEFLYYFDFFGENESVSAHLTGDIQSFLLKERRIPVRNYAVTGEPVIFSVEVMDDVYKRKPTAATNKWQEHWYVVSFSVVDEGR